MFFGSWRAVAGVCAATVLASIAVVVPGAPGHAAVDCGSIGHSYDAAGRLVGVSDQDGAAAAYDYIRSETSRGCVTSARRAWRCTR